MSQFFWNQRDSDADYISIEEEPEGDYRVLRKFQTPTQRIALVDHEGELLIYSNGYVQFGTTDDEDMFGEALVHIPMAVARKRQNVLIIGGGGGITTREALRYSGVEKIITLDVDEIMVDFGKNLKPLVQFNEGSLNHPKVQTIIEDGRKYLEKTTAKWDVIIIDVPEPSSNSAELSRLFSLEFYSLLKDRLQQGGAISIACSDGDSTPPYLWSIQATLKKAGFNVLPYHYFIPEDGEVCLFCLATISPLETYDRRMLIPTQYVLNRRLKDMFHLPYYYRIAKNKGKVQTDNNTVLIDIIDKVF